ncbi:MULTISPECIES: C25 family cysteine peptidase [Moorena]|uniref:Gingipain domain-containing protein n=1 Tax=Moorena bouillonii PNG TaxID=568701 RepID=A0A1U7NA54_9CYAN|nr:MULTISPECIES: C25 family cysteine peptidase [Moorena]NEO76509.1 hypothetical protein [Moorena sp. SIO4G3]OLT62828.1 hypothetical protein BJP37_31140 [Moorena bouillonii PNG]
MNKKILYFNGINGATGEYFFHPFSLKKIANVARGEHFDSHHLTELKDRKERDEYQPMGPIEGIDPKNLAETGWGVIFAYEYKDSSRLQAEQIKDALKELLQHRRQQATQVHENFYREYIDSRAYRTNESKVDFLTRQRVGSGPANPNKMPYYLLIVGDPESIPYHFQYQLDVQYAVGRIYFDTLEKYAQYAQSVVQAEINPPNLHRRASFFGVKNTGDYATEQSFKYLVQPLSDKVKIDQPDWSIQTLLDKEATKASLSQLLGGSETPALLFTASHGVCFPKDHPRQLLHQGALICQDWPGVFRESEKKELNPDIHYFSADDIGDDAQIHGLIAFNFACYSSGTPKLDDFAHRTGQQRSEIAPYAFMAQLPQRLLSHPKGGALAVIGHVERAWGYSFKWKRAGQQTEVFESTFKRLMEGHPIGSAVEFFNERYAELSSDLSHELEEMKYKTLVKDEDLAYLWTANNDARNYLIVGDPAVKLCGLTNEISNTEQIASKQQIELKQDIQDDIQNLVTNLEKQVKRLKQRVDGLELDLKHLREQNDLLRQQINDNF